MLAWPNLHFCQGDCGLGWGRLQAAHLPRRPWASACRGPAPSRGRLWNAAGGWLLPLLVVPSPKTVQLCCLPCCLPPSPWSASPPTQDRPRGVRETSEDPRPTGKIKAKLQSWARGGIQRCGGKKGTYPDGWGSPGSWQGSGWSPLPPPCRLAVCPPPVVPRPCLRGTRAL